ncbi:DUF998 domain-containing protein [Micromonospora sp. NPDC049799]|uniref:DUF998 domain-containing protein n=1 Tax=Micromonospora sp. NPDC049799 TaxID=3154741 RepID=UPI00340B6C11
MDPVRSPQDAQTIRRLRLGIGVVGIGLPVVLPAGHALVTGRLTLQESISGYYHTEMRNVFVGSLCAVGVFLLSYRYRRLDDLLSTVAGALAVVVALFPTTTDVPAGTLSTSDTVVGWVHQVAAAALFGVLAVFCLHLFPVRDATTPGARTRNRLYRTCGFLILAAIALGLTSALLPEEVRDPLKPLFWCEAAAVLAFGLAWLVKGEAMFRERSTAQPGR